LGPGRSEPFKLSDFDRIQSPPPMLTIDDLEITPKQRTLHSISKHSTEFEDTFALSQSSMEEMGSLKMSNLKSSYGGILKTSNEEGDG
jgi:hypothetical protein